MKRWNGDITTTMGLTHIPILMGMILSIFASGCGEEAPTTIRGSARKELLIFCGGGLRLPVAEMAETFGKENRVRMLVDYAGAEVLISKARLSKRGDIYIPGDKRHVDLAATKGLIVSQKSVCCLVPTILVQKGNPKGITGLKDIARPGIRLGLGNAPYIPIGCKSEQILEKNGISLADIETNLKFRSATVNELCLQIQANSLDAVIVWDAVAHAYTKYGDEIAIPRDQNAISTVDAGILKFTGNHDLAETFIEFARSQRGRAIFRKHNYRVDFPE